MQTWVVLAGRLHGQERLDVERVREQLRHLQCRQVVKAVQDLRFCATPTRGRHSIAVLSIRLLQVDGDVG